MKIYERSVKLNSYGFVPLACWVRGVSTFEGEDELWNERKEINFTIICWKIATLWNLLTNNKFFGIKKYQKAGFLECSVLKEASLPKIDNQLIM